MDREMMQVDQMKYFYFYLIYVNILVRFTAHHISEHIKLQN